MQMDVNKSAVIYLMIFSVGKIFQNVTTGCSDGYYRNETNGKCSICRPGYRGPNCSDPCAKGWYGKECQHKCHSTCSVCDIVDGSCPTDVTNTTHVGNVNASINIPVIHGRNSSRSASFYMVTTFGTATVLVLVLVLMFYIYKLATQSLSQNFTFTVQDPESDAEQDTLNPAYDSIYENVQAQ